VAYPLKLAGWPARRRHERVAELLEFVGSRQGAPVPEASSPAGRNSGGHARALATSPTILLADEATSALDPETTRDVLALLRRVNRELGTTIVVITHEMEVVSSLATRCRDGGGRVIEHGPIYERVRRPATAGHPPPGAQRAARPADRGDPGQAAAALHRADRGRRDPRRRHHPGRAGRQLDQHRVRATIIYGGIGELADKPFGSITYELAGDDASVDAVISELAQVATVEELHAGAGSAVAGSGRRGCR